MLLFLFVYVHSKREQNVISSYQIYSAAMSTLLMIATLKITMFKMSAFSVATSRQTTPPLVDDVVHSRLIQQTMTHLLRHGH